VTAVDLSLEAVGPINGQGTSTDGSTTPVTAAAAKRSSKAARATPQIVGPVAPKPATPTVRKTK